jgi:hypothetical protein
VKNLKLGVVAFAGVALLILLTDEIFRMLLTHPFEAGAMGLMIFGGLALALVMGIIGLTKPPFTQIHAILAAVGFGLASFKMEIWEALIHIGNTVKEPKGLILVICLVGGIIVSVMAALKPEAKA